MILGFKKHWNQGPTLFKEKIESGIKKHSIREDIHNRWCAGKPIHMAYGVRTKEYECFNNTHKCTGTQIIEIEEMILCASLCITINDKIYKVKIDGKALKDADIRLLSINDGFDTVADFLNWFTLPYKGKIIHWTDLRYYPGIVARTRYIMMMNRGELLEEFCLPDIFRKDIKNWTKEP